MSPSGGWFVPRVRRDPTARLVCFPHAGGTASAFAPWWRKAPDDVDVIAVQPPGRGSRYLELPHLDLAALALDVADALEELLLPDPTPTFLFGHSMGALVAFETVRALRARGAPLPAGLIVAAATAPGSIRPDRRALHRLPDEDFVAAVASMGGTPSVVLERDDLARLVLPALRADFTALAGYRMRAEPPLAIPIVVHAASDDPFVRLEDVDGWAEVGSVPTTVTWWTGGHFFVHTRSDEVFATVLAEIRALRGAAAGAEATARR